MPYLLNTLVPNPLGVVAVLSAFNFPVAVYGWYSGFTFKMLPPCLTYAISFRNLALSLAAGNATIWKPSPTTPLCAIAVTKIISNVLEKNRMPGAVASLVTGGKDTGEAIVESRDVELGKGYIPYLRSDDYVSTVSFTGSESVGRIVGKTVASRFGKVILELGGNNGL
jgi:aldehyde dehydrogenase family 7 protein A1